MLGSDVLFLSNILLFASSCQDTHDAIECGAWADAGECEVNPGFMKVCVGIKQMFNEITDGQIHR